MSVCLQFMLMGHLGVRWRKSKLHSFLLTILPFLLDFLISKFYLKGEIYSLVYEYLLWLYIDNIENRYKVALWCLFTFLKGAKLKLWNSTCNLQNTCRYCCLYLVLEFPLVWSCTTVRLNSNSQVLTAKDLYLSLMEDFNWPVRLLWKYNKIQPILEQWYIFPKL